MQTTHEQQESTLSNKPLTESLQIINRLREFVNSRVIGQQDVVDQVIIALISNGHVLLEGVPGLGKTLLVQTLSHCFGGQFKRIQFTPDLMPADITGHVLFDMNESRFRVRKGPVFTNLLLADEINRAPAKTQAALLEVMQEKQVTLEGSPKALPKPFMVLATQNPIEQEGTYPLPEAQLDRFLFKVLLNYPSMEDEIALTKMVTLHNTQDTQALTDEDVFLNPNDINVLQQVAADIVLDDQVLHYAVRLVRATRDSPYFTQGAGSRAAIAIVRAARANALLRGAEYVLPDDIKAMALPVLRHRVSLSAEMQMDGFSVDTVLEKVFESVDAPRL